MGGKQHAWTVNGGRWIIDQETDDPYVMAADGEPPVLCLPPGLTPAWTEVAFGFGIADLKQQREGMLALARDLARLVERAA